MKAIFSRAMFCTLLASAAVFCGGDIAAAQMTPAPDPTIVLAPPSPNDLANMAEHDREMDMLHIKALRNCNSPATIVHYAKYFHCDMPNFDEAKANPYPNLPDPLTMNDGSKVTTAAQWFSRRRPELLEIFSREIYGRMPAHMPTVTWTVDETLHETVAGVAVVTKKLTGHVDNSIDPAITVDIKMNISVPESLTGKHVPAIMTYGSLIPRPPRPGAPVDTSPDYRALIFGHGWALVAVDNTSIQADSGMGLTSGIIGLMNKGGHRHPEDWGALRAWGWGAGRGLDYLTGDPDIDAKKVGIFGHSRNGKAALVTMVYDPRFAIGFISSSGAGGASLYRRNLGENIVNVEMPGEFHWMAPNFMKYTAADKTANDIPVDTHELIALVAPRPLFFGGGLVYPEMKTVKGDGWADAIGAFRAAVAASPVYSLVGAKGIGITEPPPILTLVDSGDLAFRQHEKAHTPNPNWPYFLDFAARYFNK